MQTLNILNTCTNVMIKTVCFNSRILPVKYCKVKRGYPKLITKIEQVNFDVCNQCKERWLHLIQGNMVLLTAPPSH